MHMFLTKWNMELLSKNVSSVWKMIKFYRSLERLHLKKHKYLESDALRLIAYLITTAECTARFYLRALIQPP